MVKNISVIKVFFQVLQGAIVGLGAVLPGISGGVLCVVFGVYQTIMEFLADPIKNFKTHLPMLLPFGIGGVIGFLGIANVLSVLLETFPSQSVCVFIGLIAGMLPSLFQEAGEKGRSKSSFVAMGLAMFFIFSLLFSLKIMSVSIQPNFIWYLFCGFCLALSVIAPGMSFSTLLMPLGLYEPFVAGIGHLEFSVLLPGGIGALATIMIFAKLVERLFQKFYSVSFHAIIGIVIAATIMIIPVSGFSSYKESAINIFCIAAGILSALGLDLFQQNLTKQS